MKTYPMGLCRRRFVKDVRLPLRFRISAFSDCHFITRNDDQQSCVQLRDGRIAWIDDDTINQLTEVGIAIGGRK